MDAQRLLPPPRLRSLSLQQMALVRGGQVTDDPAPPPRAPEPCPSCPLSVLLPAPPTSSTLLAQLVQHLQLLSFPPSAPARHPPTVSPLLRAVLPLPSPHSPLLWVVSVGPAPPSLLPPVVQAFWTEQMVREGQEETSSNLGAQPDLAHSECLMPA